MTRIAQRSGLSRNRPGAEAEQWRLSRREVLAIVGFWTLFAVLTTMNRLLGDLGPTQSMPGGRAIYEAAYWVLHSYLWAAVTPLVFWLAWRFGVNRPGRMRNALLLLGAGAVIVAAMMLVRGFLWVRILNFPPVRSAQLSWSLLGALRSPWFLNDLMSYGGVLALGFTREYFVRYQGRLVETARLHAEAARLQAQLADARLETLRMQLNPHFLFNTLNTISALVERDPRGVRRMIARLSDLLRYTLQGPNRQAIPLEEEMSFLQKYLDIMQVRFEGRLEIETRVAPEVADALVPPLILQPLVENAVKHGIGDRLETGRIGIHAYRSGDRLILEVRDNGAGLRLPGEGAGGEGVGLHNVRARLQQLFGEDQDLRVRAMDGGGVLAEIELPLHTRADLRPGEVAPVPTHAAHDV